MRRTKQPCSDIVKGVAMGAPRLDPTTALAIAIEQGAELESADGDFARVRGLRWSNPLMTG